MSRMDRLRELKNPTSGPHGAGRDEKNLKFWADRASKNSTADDAVPGKPGPKEPSRPGEGDDMRRKAKSDSNTDGSTNFMPGVRRQV